ncbi:hypothetical protein DITRI_Ditri11bG0033800 [Diplodiscus trichospermus]
MDGFGAKKKAKAEALNRKPEKIRGRQQYLKRSPDESEKLAESEASDKPKMIGGLQPMQKRQKQCTDETKHAEGSSNKPQKRGRKQKLSQDERHANKIQSGRKYRQKKAANNKALQEKYQELEKENEELRRKEEVQQSEIKSLKEELSEFSARVDKVGRQMSDESKKVNVVKMANKALEPGMQRLQQDLLNQDDEEHCAENSEFNIPMDDDYLNEFVEEFIQCPDPWWSKTKGTMEGLLFGEGTSTGITKLSSDTVNVKGYPVPMENSSALQEILCLYPDIDSDFRVHVLESRNGFMNTLAKVYKMANNKEHTLEEIKYMEEGIKDLEFAGLNISWLNALVVNCKEKVPGKKGRN